MKVAGFTIIRNAIKYDYPVREAIMSVLPLCDVFYVGVGNSDDGTRELIEAIPSPKIKIVDSVWDDDLREGGKVLAIETNKVMDAMPEKYDWLFYIQSDECVHEQDVPEIKNAMLKSCGDKKVDGLILEYKHFYGLFHYIGIGRRWYRHEIRIVRHTKGIRSYKDAQGFRKANGDKLHVKKANAFIYHYGWVKPPQAQQAKLSGFHKMWHDDNWIKKNFKESDGYDYAEIDLLDVYKGTHPAIMKDRISRANWEFKYNPKKAKMILRYRILFWIEKLTGWRVGEHRNYKMGR